MAGGIQLNGPGSGPWVVVMKGLHRGWPQDERGRGWSDTILKGSGLVFQLDCDSLATACASDRAQLGLRFGGLWKVTFQSSVEVKPAAASRWEVGGPWRGILHFPNI